MKKYIFLLAVAFTLFGCSQDEANDNQESDIITVSLKLNGEIMSSESPITRADTESRDLIGITVYKGTNKFAYGIFDNMNDVKINLQAGSKYRFKCTLIKDAKDKLYFSTSDEMSSYRFSQTNPFKCQLRCNNPFSYSTSFSDYLSNSYVSIKGEYTSDYCTNIERFYGELSNYTPTVNGVVNIDLKRVSFGLKVKVTGITDGSVNFTCNNSYNTFDSQTGLTANYEGTAKMFSLYNIYNAWQYADADYQEDVNVSVTWTRSVGVTEDLGTKTVKVKRNALNIIHIKLTANGDGAGVGVQEEARVMSNESETFGN